MTHLKSFPATPAHQAARNALVDALRPFDELGPEELLAVSAQFVGQLIAFQDQRVMSGDQAMEMVLQNILHGNLKAIEDTLGPTAGAA